MSSGLDEAGARLTGNPAHVEHVHFLADQLDRAGRRSGPGTEAHRIPATARALRDGGTSKPERRKGLTARLRPQGSRRAVITSGAGRWQLVVWPDR